MSKNDEVIKVLGKRSSFISKNKYELLRNFIVDLLKDKTAVTLDELLYEAKSRYDEEFKGEVACYLLQVKLDLETRGLIKIQRIESRTQVISLFRSRLLRFYDKHL